MSSASPPPPEADTGTARITDRYWVHGLVLELTPDEALGYAQNLRCERPSVFVLWRMQHERAQPVLATASYHAGLRMLDSGEQVDAVPLPPELAGVMAGYVELHRERIQRDQDGERAGPRRRRVSQEAAD